MVYFTQLNIAWWYLLLVIKKIILRIKNESYYLEHGHIESIFLARNNLENLECNAVYYSGAVYKFRGCLILIVREHGG